MTTLRDTLRARLLLERASGADLLPVPRSALAPRPRTIQPSAPPPAVRPERAPPSVVRGESKGAPAAGPSTRSPAATSPTALSEAAQQPSRRVSAGGFSSSAARSPRVSADPAKAAALAALETRAKACRLCRLCETRTQVVFGTGNPDAAVCFVGEAPGEDEDRQGEPFVGRAGQLLNQIFAEAGLKREEVYICNVVKCRPSILENGRRRNRSPEPIEVVTCQPYLREQLALVRPMVICAMGKFAVSALLKVDSPMGQVRGRFQTRDGVPVMPTYHPAYLLRSPGEIGIVREDLKKIVAKVAEMKSKG